MRRLICVPIVHAESDLGSLVDRVAEAYERRFGRRQWQKRVRAVQAWWRGIEKRIDGFGLDLGRVVLFQDSLPVCGKEREIVEDMAHRGSPNHLLLLRLVAGGARLVGTESSDLLLREYAQAKDLLEGRMYRQPDEARAAVERAAASLVARDRFIADRIGRTLRAEEIGLLFIGVRHAVDRYLPEDVRVEFLAHHLSPEDESVAGGAHRE